MPKPVRQKSVNHKRATRSNKSQVRASQVRTEQMAATPAASIDDLDETAGDLSEDGWSDPTVPRNGTVVPALTAVPVATAAPTAATAKGARAASRRAARQPVAKAKAKTLTRDQEYGFIRADLRRLLYTAGGVMVLMIALLFVIEQ